METTMTFSPSFHRIFWKMETKEMTGQVSVHLAESGGTDSDPSTQEAQAGGSLGNLVKLCFKIKSGEKWPEDSPWWQGACLDFVMT